MFLPIVSLITWKSPEHAKIGSRGARVPIAHRASSEKPWVREGWCEVVSDRGLEVLRAIVQDYVAIGEPVGSKAIVERHSFGVSAATIRNDMAVLEDDELIAAPHTSSGRIPTDKGYRVFVDRLQAARPLTHAQRQAIARFLEPATDFDDAMQRSVRLLAQLTNQLAIVQYPVRAASPARRVELVQVTERRVLLIAIRANGAVEQQTVELPLPIDDEARSLLASLLTDAVNDSDPDDQPQLEPAARANFDVLLDRLQVLLAPAPSDRLIVAGTSNLVRTRHDFRHSVMPVLEAIEEQVTLLQLFGEMVSDGDEIVTSIGREHSGSLEETSVIAGEYAAPGSETARVGVLGPTRMDYASNMAAVRAVARYLSRVLNEDA